MHLDHKSHQQLGNMPTFQISDVKSHHNGQGGDEVLSSAVMIALGALALLSRAKIATCDDSNGDDITWIEGEEFGGYSAHISPTHTIFGSPWTTGARITWACTAFPAFRRTTATGVMTRLVSG